MRYSDSCDQSNQNSKQNQHSTIFHDRNCKRFNQFLNNQSNNINFIINEKKSNQNIEKFMMIRIFFIEESIESEESTEFVKIFNQTA